MVDKLPSEGPWEKMIKCGVLRQLKKKNDDALLIGFLANANKIKKSKMEYTQDKESKNPKELTNSQVTAYASGLILAEWCQKGDQMMSGYLGKMDDLVTETTGLELVGKKSFLEAKPKIEAFYRDWMKLSSAEPALSTDNIFQKIEQTGGLAGAGLATFKEMLAGNHKLGFQGDNSEIIKQILDSEKTSPSSRYKDLLQLSAGKMSAGYNSPQAARALASAFLSDPHLKEQAQEIVERPVESSNVSTSPLDLLRSAPELSAFAFNFRTVGEIRAAAAVKNAATAFRRGAGKPALDAYSSTVATGLVGTAGALIFDSALNNLTPPGREQLQQMYIDGRYLYDAKTTKQRLENLASEGAYSNKIGRKFGESQIDADLTPILLSIENQNNPERDERKIISDLEEFKNRIGSYSSIPPERYMESVNSVRNSISNYIDLYIKEQNTLTGTLDNKGGNCVSRTKTLIEAIRAAGIKFPRDVQMGIQLYKRHLEPVLYNSKDDTALGLIDGHFRKEINSPIYRPEMLALLEQADPGIDEVYSGSTEGKQNLLLSKHSPEDGIGQYSKDPIPKYAFGNFGKISAKWSDNPQSGNYFDNIVGQSNTADNLEGLLVDASKKDYILPHGFGVSSSGVVFADARDVNIFNSLTTIEEKYGFLIHKHRMLAEELIRQNEKAIKQVMSAMEDPSKISNPDLEAATHLFSDFRKLGRSKDAIPISSAQIGIDFTQEYGAPNCPYLISVLGSDFLKGTRLKTFVKAAGSFWNNIRDPEKFIRLIAMKNDSVVDYVKLIDTELSFGSPTLNDTDLFGRIAEKLVISNDDKIRNAITNRQGNVTGLRDNSEANIQVRLPLGPADLGEFANTTPGKFGAYLIEEDSNRSRSFPIRVKVFNWIFMERNLSFWMESTQFDNQSDIFKEGLRGMTDHELVQWGKDIDADKDMEFLMTMNPNDSEENRYAKLRSLANEVMRERNLTY